MYSAGRIRAWVIAFRIPAGLHDSGEIVHSLVMIVIAGYLITDALRISCI